MNCNQPNISDELLMLLEDELPEEQHKEMMEHLANCTQCRKEFEEISEATCIIRKEAVKIKERWAHPSPDDLNTFVFDPDDLHEEQRNHIQAHLHWCHFCREEVELLDESPELPLEHSEEAVMPPELLTAFRNAYGSKKATQGVKVGTAKPSFWDRFKNLTFLPPRYAHAMTALMLAIGFMLGSYFGPPLIQAFHSRPVPTTTVAGHYSEYPLNGLSDENSNRLLGYLREQGIDAREKDGKLWIREDQMQVAFGALVKYQQLYADPGSIRTVGENSPAPDNSIPQPENSPGLTMGENDTDSILEKWLREKHGNPQVTIASSPSMLPVDTTHRPDTLPESGGILAVTFPGENELFQSSSADHGGKISRWSTGAPEFIHHEALTSAPDLLEADLEGRERSTVKIQGNFRNKIQEVLSLYPNLSGSLLYVTVSLDFERNEHYVYPIRGVKVTVVTRHTIGESEQRVVIERIRKAVEWKDTWDGGIEFATP